MYIIRFVAHCPAEQAEVLSEALEHAERVIEEHISLRLLELFGGVIVDDISVEYVPFQDTGGDLFPFAA